MDYPDFYSKGPTPCSQVENPDDFFPDLEEAHSLSKATVAKKVCGDCVYRVECLAWALANDEPGVWGGTSFYERKKMKRNGSAAAYLRSVHAVV